MIQKLDKRYMKNLLKNKITIPVIIWVVFACAVLFQLAEYGKFSKFLLIFSAIGFMSSSIALILIDPNDKKESKGDKDNG